MSRKTRDPADNANKPDDQHPTSVGNPAEQPPKQKRPRKEGYDAFFLDELYPDPLSIFKYQPQSLQDVKDSAVVVLDASVLLLPYSSNSGSLKEIERVYADLAGGKRLVVPARAAREFACHRFEKIVELARQVEQKRNGLQDLGLDASSLLNELPEIEQYREMIKNINKSIKQCRDLLGTAGTKIRQWYCNDPVSRIYERVITTDALIETQGSRDKILSDNERRNTHEIAPGYKDQDKEDGGVGDKIIWNCILEIGANKKAPLIFVTNDFMKGDAGHVLNEELLFARYELVEEFRRASSGQAFYMCKLSALMGLFSADKNAVEDIRRVELNQREERLLKEIYEDFADVTLEPPDTVLRHIIPEHFTANAIHRPRPGEIRVLPGKDSYSQNLTRRLDLIRTLAKHLKQRTDERLTSDFLELIKQQASEIFSAQSPDDPEAEQSAPSG